MLNNNFNSHTLWDLRNPDNPRLNKKQALWARSKKKKKQSSTLWYPSTLITYEVKDETSTKNTCQKIITGPFFRRGKFWVVLHQNTHGFLGIKTCRKVACGTSSKKWINLCQTCYLSTIWEDTPISSPDTCQYLSMIYVLAISSLEIWF
jgi:hypothetical protein